MLTGQKFLILKEFSMHYDGKVLQFSRGVRRTLGELLERSSPAYLRILRFTIVLLNGSDAAPSVP